MTTKDEIKQILEYRRFFFLALDKKTNPSSKYSFSTPQKLKPLFSDITTWDGTHATCLRVCLSEQTAYYDEEINKSYYSKITSSELERLCKISEAETSLMINFIMTGNNKLVEIPIKAGEVFEILSKRTVFSSLKNFYKSHTGKMYIIEDIFLFIFFIILYTAFVLKPRAEARFARENLEGRRLVTLESGLRDITDYDYQGRIFHESTTEKDQMPAYDEDKRMIGWIYTKRLSDKYYEYDTAGNMILEKEVFTETAEQQNWGKEPSEPKTTDGTIEIRYRYNKDGNLIFSESSDGKKNMYNYDEEGRLVSMKTESGAESIYEYDEEGNLSVVTNSDGITEKYKFNNGRVSKITVEDKQGKSLKTVYYNYDDNGNLVKVSNIRDDNWDIRTSEDRTYEYNSEGLRNYEIWEYVSINWKKTDGNSIKKARKDEAWYMYDFYRDGTIKQVIRYY